MGEPVALQRRSFASLGEAADAVIRCLRLGGVVLLPTDTVYGLAAHPTQTAAIEKLFELKGRPSARQLPVLLDPEQVPSLGGEITAEAAKLLSSPWSPGPLSIVLALRKSVAPAWLAGRDEVAFRAPADPGLRSILRETGPLFVTSANRHGDATPNTLELALASLHGTPDIAVDGGTLSSVASTLVNCRYSPPRVEREGQVPASDLERFLA